MQHLTTRIKSISGLERFLEKHKDPIASAQSILVQVYVFSHDTGWIMRITSTVSNFMPQAVIVGATTDGEILEGRALTESTVMSISLFDEVTLVPIAQKVLPGTEQEAAQLLSRQLRQIDRDIKGLLLFSTPFSIDCNVMLDEIFKLYPGLPIFGGGAADYADMDRTLVFYGENIFETGLVAVAMIGDALQLLRRTYLGWRPIGKTMTATHVHGFTVHEIDGKPAFEVYRKYLGLQPDKHFYLNALEFPFLIKRESQTVARVPVFTGQDGSVTFIADIHEGEQLQLGYGDIDLILEDSAQMQREVMVFDPQAIYFYSCSVRRFLMQQEVDLELQPFRAMAPSTGFFTYGEFCDLGDVSPLMSAAVVIVALREGPPEQKQIPDSVTQEFLGQFDRYQQRHAHILKRFLHFLDAVTNDFSLSNADLKSKLDEIRQLRDILPMCASCRKIRDDQGYWSQLENYMQKHTNVAFSHGLCPECIAKLYPELEIKP